MKPALIVAVLALFGVAFAQTWTPGATLPAAGNRHSCRVPPESWTYVLLQGGGAGYVVPPDSYFVVTTLYRPTYPEVFADGELVTRKLFATDVAYGTQTSVTFEPGTVLTAGPGEAELWGYLEPVR